MLSILAALLLTSATPAHAQSHAWVTIESCHDGDTCWVRDGSSKYKVRLAGIDAPEKNQAGGDQARKFLLSMIKNKKVELECVKKRSYDRKVCAMRVGGLDVQAEMVKAGWAWDYPKYSHHKYEKLMLQAQSRKIGIWKNGTQVKSPSCFRLKGKKRQECLQNPNLE